MKLPFMKSNTTDKTLELENPSDHGPRRRPSTTLPFDMKDNGAQRRRSSHDEEDLRALIKELRKDSREKGCLKRSLAVSAMAGLLLLATCASLGAAVFSLSNQVKVDEHGQLIDPTTGEMVVTRPEATLIVLTPDAGLARRLVSREVQETLGLNANREGRLGGDGREYLGTAPRRRVKRAYQRFLESAEDVNVDLEVEGTRYTRALDLGRIERRWRGDGSRPNRDRPARYGGIFLRDEEESDGQEYQVDCDDDPDTPCEVYSVGTFRVPRRKRKQNQRHLQDWVMFTCLKDADCKEGQTCDLTEGKSGGQCTCTTDSDCQDLPHPHGHATAEIERESCSAKGRCHVIGDCFSAAMTAETPSGPKRMDELEVNDRVLTASGTYQKVYAWHHRTPEIAAAGKGAGVYLQFVTEASGSIELTKKHMIYVNGNEHPIEAGKVKVGDYLSMMQSPTIATFDAKVTATNIVSRKGGFAPVTEDGTIVVNGFVASTHSNPRYADSEFVEVAGMTLIHRQAFTQLMLGPLRMICIYVSGNICAVDMDEEVFLPGSKTVDNVYQAFLNAGLESYWMVFLSIVLSLLRGLELFCKFFGLAVLAAIVIANRFGIKFSSVGKKLDEKMG